LSYALSDALSLSTEFDKNKTTFIVATYTAGDMIAKRGDDTTDAFVSLSYGNAVLSFGCVGECEHSGAAGTISPEYTHVSYKVSF
jgi:hypothetical protein